jgi:hypothetical protein
MVRHAPDFVPLFFPYILIDFDCPGVETVATAFLAARNPMMFPGLPVKIVGLETAA